MERNNNKNSMNFDHDTSYKDFFDKMNRYVVAAIERQTPYNQPIHLIELRNHVIYARYSKMMTNRFKVNQAIYDISLNFRTNPNSNTKRPKQRTMDWMWSVI